MKLFFAMLMTLCFATAAYAVPPKLVFKNQQGEETIASILSAGSTFIGSPVAANTIVSNLTGSSAFPSANTYSAVSAKLLPTQLLTGFTAGGGTVSATDTVIQGLQKIAGNVAAHQADSVAVDVAALVVDFNALLAKLQAAKLMQ